MDAVHEDRRRIARILDQTAEGIVERGTRSEARVLSAVSDAVRHLAPGAAAALTDWGGSEVARQRAFGVVHGVVLGELGALSLSRLHDRLTGTDRVEAHRAAA